TGVGNKEDEKFRSIYGIENEGSPTRLEDAIRAAGHQPQDVDIVLNTHLHFDHAGGDTLKDEEGRIVPAFPRARHLVQGAEWRFAHQRNERVRASYLPDNFEPVHAAGLFDFVEGEAEVVPGMRVLPAPGHTPGQHVVLLESDDERACFLADLVPTAAHVPLPWIMGYDVEPLVSLESKRTVLARAQREAWLLIFQHDAAVPWGRLAGDEPRPTLLPPDD
ncbi:MAG TPA: MBL fold metallo-hydrolase, partial [Longimicrobiales bacterium]|nr:MBL fold metallo-hydrolase [Longimicrobiales bacterium]